jgi:soluble lytic murein transglycosylase
MQKIWHKEAAKRSGLFYFMSASFAVCLLTGTALGVGSLVSAKNGEANNSVSSKSAKFALIDGAVFNDIAPAAGNTDKQQNKDKLGVSDVEGHSQLKQASAKTTDSQSAAGKPAASALKKISQKKSDELTQHIFKLQRDGHWSAADKLIAHLNDDEMRGHILFQRYMHPAYKSNFEELKAWLDKYPELPGADKIYVLAQKRKPTKYVGPLSKPINARPIIGQLSALDSSSATYSSNKKRNAEQTAAINKLRQAVKRDLSQNQPTAAYKVIKTSTATKFLDSVEQDQIYADIAARYMFDGKVKRAYEIANVASKRSGSNAPMAAWIAGLSGWRLGHYEQAAKHFEAVATSPFTSSWMSAAGAYWASRSHMRAGNTKEVAPWLRQAAAQPRTFYGLIATRALGWEFDFNWSTPKLTNAQKARLAEIPAARRAAKLVEAKQFHLAEEELKTINTRNDVELRQALIAYAHQAKLPSYGMRLAETTETPNGQLYDAALYPVVPWKPDGGYEVDRALIHAIMRQESRFDTKAKSHVGATGLMQLMPNTAKHVAKQTNKPMKEGTKQLHDPELNITLGQSYIAELLQQDAVKADLFSLAIAYNAGPGNLRKWKNKHEDIQDDPLLFIESIPAGETRMFVEKVLANYWIYRLRMNQKVKTLDDVAAGKSVIYAHMDKDTVNNSPVQVASNN